MFKTRLLSGILLMIIAIAAMVAGGYVLFGLITVISVIGLFELYRVAGMEKKGAAWIGYLAGIFLDIAILVGGAETVLAVLIAAMMCMLAVYVVTYPKYHANQIMLLVFGVCYVTLMLSYVYRVRILDGGIYSVWLIFVGSWGSDTCAYCVGKLVGKHKLPSKLSPNKTIEGCVGGVAGAALIGAVYAKVFADSLTMFQEPVLAFAVIGAVSSVISQIGDLAASGIKRNYDIKDYGKLIPGHGGILDRFDSVIFIAPAVYYLLTFLFL